MILHRRSEEAVLVCAVVCLSVMSVEMSIEGPRPMNVVTPIGSTITFTCHANLTELTANTFFGVSWIVDGVALPDDSRQDVMGNGLFRNGTLQLDASQDYTTGVLIQCVALARESPGSFMILEVFRSGNATFTTFGISYVNLKQK